MGHYAVDLDGTLARNDGPEYERGDIGQPVPAMMQRVRRWLREGKEVKILTARADSQERIDQVKDWLEDNGLPPLEVTNVKEPEMEILFDDRATGVVANEGILLTEPKKKTPKNRKISVAGI